MMTIEKKLNNSIWNAIKLIFWYLVCECVSLQIVE